MQAPSKFRSEQRLSTTIFRHDGKRRCTWCTTAPEYFHYHDTEWGFPVTDDYRLFEKICLEGFQSGLSWLTILRKRENFRLAFDNFDFRKIAEYTAEDVERLLSNDGIIRNRRKIEAVVNNAQRALELVRRDGSLAAFLWSYAPSRGSAPAVPMPATSAESIALSADLKKLGWKFVGPTNMYAFMQAMGLVNDHEIECVARSQVNQAALTN
jgi:DNA-3-methyladenine glycosylase I